MSEGIGVTIPIGRIDPELRGPMRRVPRLPLGNELGRWMVRRMLRAMPAVDTGDVRVEVLEADGAMLRLYHPPVRRAPAGLLWIHGGGYVIGRPEQDDRFAADTARTLGITVASVKYRLVPEHPFPAPLDDCLAGWRLLRTEAGRLGLDRNRLAIGGQSAGGGLAATLVQRAHDLGEGAAAQLLSCPMLDDRTAADRAHDAARHPIWSNRANRTAWRAYLRHPPGTADLPAYAAAARREDLAGLPPAWIGFGDVELFAGEDLGYAERLRAAGVAVETRVAAGAPHGFEAWAYDTRIAREYLSDARGWLARALSIEGEQTC